MTDVRILTGDCLETLRTLPAESVNCCVTSPPYWGLRDYGVTGQLGLEATPEEYVAKMVAVFREVRRVLRDDGTLWLNLGDSYAGYHGNARVPNDEAPSNRPGYVENMRASTVGAGGLKPKDLVGIPWRVSRAMQEPYYTGRVKRERDRVWLAATLDAEGTICGFDHTRADDGSHRSGVHVAITNTSALMLDEAARIWPASRAAHQRPHPGHLGKRDSWRWIVHGIENKMAVLRELYPYLIVKRRQAIVAYSLLLLMADAKRLGHSPQKDEVLAKRRTLTGLLSALNQGTAGEMPDWLTEPPGLHEQGWWLRSDIIWHKPNPMPESVTDRPTKAHEYVFLMAKSETYEYDDIAISEPSVIGAGARRNVTPRNKGADASRSDGDRFGVVNDGTRNARSVWSINSEPFAEAHFATMPTRLVERCVKAGSTEGGHVLDPFGGAGTTGLVAQRLGRSATLIELNPTYAAMARKRIDDDAPLFMGVR